MSGKVIDKDHGYKALVQTLEGAAGATVKVGVQGEQDSQLALIASVQEFGTQDGRVPQRSYMRATFDQKKEELEKSLAKVMNQVIDKKIDVQTGINIVGEQFASMVRDRIRSNIPPPLSPSTLSHRVRKIAAGAKRNMAAAQVQASGTAPAGSIIALIDSGRLIQSIRSVAEV